MTCVRSVADGSAPASISKRPCAFSLRQDRPSPADVPGEALVGDATAEARGGAEWATGAGRRRRRRAAAVGDGRYSDQAECRRSADAGGAYASVANGSDDDAFAVASPTSPVPPRETCRLRRVFRWTVSAVARDRTRRQSSDCRAVRARATARQVAERDAATTFSAASDSTPYGQERHRRRKPPGPPIRSSGRTALRFRRQHANPQFGTNCSTVRGAS